MLAAIGGHAVALVRPELRLPTRIAGHMLALAGLAVLWLGGDLLVPTSQTAPEKLAHVIQAIDRYANAGLGLIAAITAIELGRDAWKLVRARRAAQLTAAANGPRTSGATH
jgi:hypothetical protein